MQCACATVSSVACPALQYFCPLSRKWQDFRRNVTEHKMCVLIFSTTFAWNISHSRTNRERDDQKYILVFLSSTRYSCQILMKLEFSWQVFEKSSSIKFHENSSIRPLGAELLHADRKKWRNWQSLFAILWTRLTTLQTKVCRVTQKTRVMLNNFVSENCAVYEIGWAGQATGKMRSVLTKARIQTQTINIW